MVCCTGVEGATRIAIFCILCALCALCRQKGVEAMQKIVPFLWFDGKAEAHS